MIPADEYLVDARSKEISEHFSQGKLQFKVSNEISNINSSLLAVETL